MHCCPQLKKPLKELQCCLEMTKVPVQPQNCGMLPGHRSHSYCLFLKFLLSPEKYSGVVPAQEAGYDLKKEKHTSKVTAFTLQHIKYQGSLLLILVTVFLLISILHALTWKQRWLIEWISCCIQIQIQKFSRFSTWELAGTLCLRLIILLSHADSPEYDWTFRAVLFKQNRMSSKNALLPQFPKKSGRLCKMQIKTECKCFIHCF